MKKNIYIVGAHSRGQTLAQYLQYLYPGMCVTAYLYDNDEQNPDRIGNIRVIHLGSGEALHTDYPVYIGTRGVYHQQIEEHLSKLGFTEIHPVTVELDLRLRNAYMEKYFAEIGRKFEKIEKLDSTEKEQYKNGQSAVIYVARSFYDKVLQQRYKLACYEKEIQVGAALVKERFSNHVIADDIGDNISSRNQQFCELTALYWIWKHAKEDIIGLVHYRRHFILPEDWISRMQGNKIDVILPIPLFVAPSLAENYKNRHDPSDWNNMMEYLKRRNIEEYQESDCFFQKNLYSPCNMFIMRKEVLHELCKWLFPILFAVTEQGGKKKDRYLNRYPGFISERLMSFFFEKYHDRYKVVYSDKNFLS